MHAGLAQELWQSGVDQESRDLLLPFGELLGHRGRHDLFALLVERVEVEVEGVAEKDPLWFQERQRSADFRVARQVQLDIGGHAVASRGEADGDAEVTRV